MSLKEYKRRVRNIKRTSLELILASREAQSIISQFKIPLLSFEERITFASENLNCVYLTQNQKILVNEIAKEMVGLIPFSDFVIRGFLLRAIKKWQQKHNQPIALVSRMERNTQFRIGVEILNNTKEYLNRAVYIREKKLKKKYLDEILRQVTEIYDELLSAQAFLSNPDNEEILLDYEIDNWLEENSCLFKDKK